MTNIISIALSLILPLVLLIYGDKIKEYYSNKSIKNTEKRIYQLRKNLNRYSSFRNNPSTLITWGLNIIFTILIWIFVLYTFRYYASILTEISTEAFKEINYTLDILSFIVFYVIFLNLVYQSKTIKNLRDYERYILTLNKKIEQAELAIQKKKNAK
ncbi:hypothetical protein D3P07_00855 [Paenibacillus sp. 1011MAR3C5]|uniref:hypothetical protein n=1 Tax=Paenibacillus sp. 1011MAR3C5 TaxID=1675787 RepID=UPI000E6D4CDD|nr:hypothetical protein [Paenibacillus sp. 1011MAR3C5]RJE90690.1 hypothetical protein D3P07_00855 [Paenibacillus sp. 1011MAR3C5]